MIMTEYIMTNHLASHLQLEHFSVVKLLHVAGLEGRTKRTTYSITAPNHNYRKLLVLLSGNYLQPHGSYDNIRAQPINVVFIRIL